MFYFCVMDFYFKQSEQKRHFLFFNVWTDLAIPANVKHLPIAHFEAYIFTATLHMHTYCLESEEPLLSQPRCPLRMCLLNSTKDTCSTQLAEAHANGILLDESRIQTTVFPTNIMFTLASTSHVIWSAFVLLVYCVCHEKTDLSSPGYLCLRSGWPAAGL